MMSFDDVGSYLKVLNNPFREVVPGICIEFIETTGKLKSEKTEKNFCQRTNFSKWWQSGRHCLILLFIHDLILCQMKYRSSSDREKYDGTPIFRKQVKFLKRKCGVLQISVEVFDKYYWSSRR